MLSLNNKTFFLPKLKDYKIILIIVRTIFFRFIFKFLTTFSYLSYVNTNYIYSSFYDLKSNGFKNMNIFFNTFLLNISVDYNFIYIKVKNRRILIKNQKIEFNPPSF